MGYIITGFVRRGGGRAQEAHWTGRSWSKKKAMHYPTAAAARKAADSINATLVDSVAIYEAPRPR